MGAVLEPNTDRPNPVPSLVGSNDEADIKLGPLITQYKAKDEAHVKEKAIAVTESSTTGSKRKFSSLEDSNEKSKKTKRNKPTKKNAARSKKPSNSEALKVQVDGAAEAVFRGFKLTKILAKGWETPLGDRKSCWCYLVEWEEDTATGTRTGDTTWEPVTSIKRDQGMMVDLFESRMLEASKKGPPAWKDVEAIFKEDGEDKGEMTEESRSYEKNVVA